MPIRLLLALAVFAVATAATADVYRWKDQDGNIIFSDSPQPGSEKIELNETTIVPALKPPRQSSRPAVAVKAPFSYESITIASPANEETVRNVAAVSVSVAVKPELRADEGDTVQLYVNGKPFAQPSTSTSFTLAELPRGEHRLEAALLNAAGAEIKRSPGIVFYLRQHSIQHPPPANPGPR